MSLLMPEYERQLRAAARRLADETDAAGSPAKPSRGGLGSRLFLAVTGGVAVAIAIAVAAVVLVGHHGSPPQSTPAAQVPALQYDCAPHQILPTKGPLVATAHGVVGGQRWTLEIDSGRQGLRSVQAGRFLLGGRAYGFCETGLDVELVNAGPRGIVYGFAARSFQPPIVIETTTAHGTAASPVPAQKYPATTRQVPGGLLFLRALPASACAYRVLGVAAAERATNGGGAGTILAMTGAFTASCAPGALLQARREGSGPAIPGIAPPAGLSRKARAEYDAGRAEVGRAGCLACHQIGDQGNNGPGPDLTHVGKFLNSRALRSILVNPTAPMPSFKGLPARSRRAIVAFLRALR